jgi:hypothetical protein
MPKHVSIDPTYEVAATIADVAALTGGESPTEAEFNALAVKFNLVLAALEGAGIVASA